MLDKLATMLRMRRQEAGEERHRAGDRVETAEQYERALTERFLVGDGTVADLGLQDAAD